MITVISGTNRQNSECKRYAEKYAEFLREHSDEEVGVLALEDIPHDWFHAGMYSEEGQSDSLRRLQDEFMLAADKYVFITPEYNGGFPGAVKLFIDACSVRAYRQTLKDKKAALVGIATGRAGNLRGMEHLTGVLNHLGIIVMPNKLPISRIAQLSDEETGDLEDLQTLQTMESHALAFLNF